MFHTCVYLLLLFTVTVTMINIINSAMNDNIEINIILTL